MDDEQLALRRKKAARDPLSHRIIEKKRRDRMNSCLANLSKLLPSVYLKRSRGRVEKTEIIEMAAMHLQYLQSVCNSKAVGTNNNYDDMDPFYFGYQECIAEVMHFLVEIEGFYASDSLCIRLLTHLRKHCSKTAQYHTKRFQDVKREFNDPSDSSEVSQKSNESSDNEHTDFSKYQNFQEITEIHPKSEFNEVSNDNIKYENDQLINLIPMDLPVSQQENKQFSEKMQNVNSNCQSPSSQNEEIYKYKTRIKRRFHADLQQNSQNINNNGICKQEPRESPDFCTNSSSNLNPLVKSLPPLVDISSLIMHPDGNFYIPLLTDTKSVSPVFSQCRGSPNNLQPINIAFCVNNSNQKEFENSNLGESPLSFRYRETSDKNQFSTQFS